MSDWTVLAARLCHELQSLDRVVARVQSQVDKARQSGDEDFYQAAALSLQNYYMGIERIFEEVAKWVDRFLPTGASSHRELLEQMGLEIPNVRPAVLSAITLRHLNEFRAFRHVAIHLYGFELYPERIGALADDLPNCHNLLRAEVTEFCQFLLALTEEL